jgi:hypothetical protein
MNCTRANMSLTAISFLPRARETQLARWSYLLECFWYYGMNREVRQCEPEATV